MDHPSKHCSTGTIPAQYRGYCRDGTGPPLFYCHHFAHRHFTGPVLVNCYPTGISRHKYITLIVSYMYWLAIGLAYAQYRIQCQGNEHMPLCAPNLTKHNYHNLLNRIKQNKISKVGKNYLSYVSLKC